MDVIFWIPLGIVHTYWDTGNFIAMFPQDAFQTASLIRGLRLRDKSQAGQNDSVGKKNAGLEAIHTSVKFDSSGGEIISGQVCEAKVVAPEVALISSEWGVKTVSNGNRWSRTNTGIIAVCQLCT